MQISIHDRAALLEISPAALSAYARIAGWSQHESYREHSDIYIGDTLPEIIVPRTTRLGDYASAVAALIETFAQVAQQDAMTVYRSLVTADRDIIRIRAAESDDGSLGLDDGVKLVRGARDMVLAVTCSLHDPQPVYRPGANREATNLLRQMRLGQTDQGSFTTTLLTPAIPPPIPSLVEDPDDHNAPLARRMTRRLVEALDMVLQAMERASTGDGDAFGEVVASGVSANLCESLARIVGPFATLDIGVSLARTRLATLPRHVFPFGRADVALLDEAARSLRERAPKPDVRLQGFVRILGRGEEHTDGRISLRTVVDRQPLAVVAVLKQTDYEQAIQAHKDRATVTLTGDLERAGQRWRLLNPHIENILRDDGQAPEEGSLTE